MNKSDPLRAALQRVAVKHGNGSAVVAASAALPLPTALPKLPPLGFAELRLKARLLAAAMRRCDQLGDAESAREEMQRQCLEVPVGQWEELLAYFVEIRDG